MSEFTYNVPALPATMGQGDQKNYNTSSNQQTGNGNSNNFPFSHFSHQSSFSSSGSGSATGGSFSSVDALPAISRDFARPTSSETRRPATAGGALHPTRAFGALGGQGMIQESNDENDDSQGSSPFNDPTRRASESTLQWPMHHHAPLPMHNNFGQQVQREMARVAYQQSRPQTSDGLPHHAMTAALPSIPSINHVDSSVFYRPTPDMGMSTFPGNPSYSLSSSSVRPSFLNGNPEAGSSSQTSDSKQNFVSMSGAAHKKRPRRTFDQIERLYNCGWNGCDKSYGTLNHLNAHVATQKHGIKRLPSEFKDMRKSHKKKKKENAAAAANAQYAHHVQQAGHPYAMPWTRGSITSSSGSDERRESNASYMTSDYSGRSSIYSAYGMSDSRPSTAGSMVSTGEVGMAGPGPASAAYATAMPQWGYGDFTNGVGRRASAPTHIPMPQNAVENGFRQIEGDFPTPTPQNPFPQMNANGMRQYHSTLSGPMAAPQQLNQGFEQQFAFQR